MAMDEAQRRELHEAARDRLTDRYFGGSPYWDPFEAMRKVHTAASGCDPGGNGPVPQEDVLAALTQVAEARQRLDSLERGLIEQARHRGASWQRLADAQGFATRQSAESRALRLQRAASISGGRDVAAQRLSQARQRAGEAWCLEHDDRIRDLCDRLVDSSSAWTHLTSDPHAASIVHELVATLTAGGNGVTLMRVLSRLHLFLSPYGKPQPEPFGQQAAAAVKVRNEVTALLAEQEAVQLSVCSAREAGQ
ncbi:hypothetical protein ACFCZ1_26650 [Streptomyces sp. NPDC056224]|uniref:hypothetical protein n=1 Tax=Streptomyces sp. NPDC056224 TaxID=3345750 RepID=UPI0035E12D92